MTSRTTLFPLLCFLVLLGCCVPAWSAEPATSPHQEFATTIIKRLRFADGDRTERVIAATFEYLVALELVLADRTATLDRLAVARDGTGKADTADVVATYEKAKRLYLPLRDAYVDKLEADLAPYLIERVKDGLTHDALPRLHAMYLEMIPTLTPAEKAHVLGLLVEARENAMLAISAEGQKQWFDKYRGIINNFIASQGHDFSTLSKAWDATHSGKQ